MRAAEVRKPLQPPRLIQRAQDIAGYLKDLSTKQLAQHMKISPAVAQKTAKLYAEWTTASKFQTSAIDCFRGDIYSGLQAQTLSASDRLYADKHLVILSGLYGNLRALDGIMPYRLEMLYKFADPPFDNLYSFWGSAVADLLPETGLIINTSSAEYSKLVLPFVDEKRVVTPQFFTVSPKTGKPTFVTVHSKIARGAFAHWLITSRAQDTSNLTRFDALGYRYNAELSKPGMPAFVAQEFGGIGLSIRLQA